MFSSNHLSRATSAGLSNMFLGSTQRRVSQGQNSKHKQRPVPHEFN